MGTLATHDDDKLRDMLMQQVYGPDLDQAKTDSEVLSVIKSLEQGPARDQALNIGMNTEDFTQLMEFELAQRHAVYEELTAPALAAGAHALEVNAANTPAGVVNALSKEHEHIELHLSGTIAYIASSVLSSDENGDALFYVDENGQELSDQDEAANFHGDIVEDERNAAAAYHQSLLAGSEGQQSEEKQRRILMVRGQRYSLAPDILALIQEMGKVPETLEAIAAKVKEVYNLEITQTRLRNILRLGLAEVKEFKEQQLRPCYPVIYIVVEKVRMFTNATLVVEHPFYIIMGMNIDGTHDLMDIAPFPRDYTQPGAEQQMWEQTFRDLKARGLVDPIYVVTGDVHEFKPALHAVFPRAIYQHSLRDILRHASEPMTTIERANFFNDCRVLHSSKSLLECMRALIVLESKWSKSYPSATQLIRDNWIFFEQYYAANNSVRVSIRTTKTLDLLLNHLRRDIRVDSQNYLYRDALHVVARILELDRYVTGMRHPVQWKRALRHMLEDRYVGTILGNYITFEDVKLSPRSIKRDQALEQAAHAKHRAAEQP